tara:strand:+ start:137 stop:877 length:741 start_codon:yes stop_codon:yes gene_type:complete
MVSVDTVYQKVLALANKEQRGYITPQDFNLFANQAQMEIFEQYFYDTNLARKNQGNDTVYADVDDMLEEKLQIFEEFEESVVVNTWATSFTAGVGTGRVVPNYIYRISRIEFNQAECEIMNTKDFENARLTTSRLLSPTSERPIANIRNNIMRCKISSITNTLNISNISVFYFKKPEKVNWTYVVVNKQAMYNANLSTQDFELHSSEENNLVNKILMLAGLANRQPDVMGAGQGMDMATKQQQPKI